MDAILNVAFFVFHTSWMAFNGVGWIWRRTRRWPLATVSLTAVSWIGLGAFHGWGYCPCTDWHWQVRARLGHEDPPSYIQLLITVVFGIDPGSDLADALAVVTLSAAGLLAVVVNLRDWRASRKSTQA
jgi:hypothetical protein